MSNLHLTKDNRPIWETDTMDHFNKSINIIRGMKDIYAIIVTGDIHKDYVHSFSPICIICRWKIVTVNSVFF